MPPANCKCALCSAHAENGFSEDPLSASPQAHPRSTVRESLYPLKSVTHKMQSNLDELGNGTENIHSPNPAGSFPSIFSGEGTWLCLSGTRTHTREPPQVAKKEARASLAVGSAVLEETTLVLGVRTWGSGPSSTTYHAYACRKKKHRSFSQPVSLWSRG